MKSIITYALGAIQFLFGVVALFTGYVDHSQAMLFIMNGAAVFGLTQQNVKIGAKMGHAV